MIELLKHIEALLLENDCVIIPSFGGFVSHYTSARWIEEEGLFLPPTRSIGFNPQLKMNDGLLVQSYMTAYCTDFSDASKLVERAVKELDNTLHNEGKVEMHGIGDMFYTIHENLQFKPYEDGVTTPGLYGLSSFEISKLDDIVKENDKETIVDESNSDVYEIRVSRSFLRTAVAVAAAVIVFFLMSTPVQNTYVEKSNYAQLVPSELFESIGSTNKSGMVANNNLKYIEPSKTKDLKADKLKENVTSVEKKQEPLKPKAIKEITIPKKEEKKADQSKKSDAVTSTAKGGYHIIAASVTNRTDAQEIVDRLKAKGYSNATYIVGKSRVRVSLMSFTSDAEANKKLSQLKRNSNFKDAWVYTSK